MFLLQLPLHQRASHPAAHLRPPPLTHFSRPPYIPLRHSMISEISHKHSLGGCSGTVLQSVKFLQIISLVASSSFAIIFFYLWSKSRRNYILALKRAMYYKHGCLLISQFFFTLNRTPILYQTYVKSTFHFDEGV